MSTKHVVYPLSLPETPIVTGIKDLIVNEKAHNGIIIDIMGRRVDSNYRGFAIKDGTKMIIN